jgi:hypothetical protein
MSTQPQAAQTMTQRGQMPTPIYKQPSAIILVWKFGWSKGRTNPPQARIRADIRKGTFGTAALQLADFKTAGHQTIGPVSPSLVSVWYSIDITSAKARVNQLATLSGLTQIRLRFNLDDNNNAVANYLKLYSGNAGAASRPKLIIQYFIP